MGNTKKCSGKCGLEKSLDCFEYRKDSQKYRPECKGCVHNKRKPYWNKYNKDNKDKQKKYRKDNADKIKTNRKNHYKENKETTLSQQREYKSLNKEELSVKNKEHYINNREHKLEYQKEYAKENKEKINKWSRTRAKENPAVRIRRIMSITINHSLKNNDGSKNNIGCLTLFDKDYPKKIREHIESLFEYWMTWENHGKYNKKTWNNNDPSTWTWNIDHIIPHSYFEYISPTDPECLMAWSLANLRPLSAKQNIIDGYRLANTELHKTTMCNILKELNINGLSQI